MRWLGILALLLPGLAKAYCMPKAWYWPVTTATAEVQILPTPAGEASYWWCQQPDKTWRLYTWVRLRGSETPELRSGIETVIRSASSPDAGVAQAFALYSRIPATGTAARFEFDRLAYIACKAGVANPPTSPARDTCVPPSEPVQAYVVDPNGAAADGTRPAYPFANGIRGTTSSGRAQATPKTDCGAPRMNSTNGRVWSNFGPAFDPAKVTLCIKSP